MKSPILSLGDTLYIFTPDNAYVVIGMDVERGIYFFDYIDQTTTYSISGVDSLIRDGTWKYKSKKKIDFDNELEKL